MLVFLIGLFCYHFFYFLPGLKKKKSKAIYQVGGDIPKKKKPTLEEEDNTQCSSDRVKKKKGRKEKKLELRTNLTANNDDKCPTQKNRNGSDRSSKKSKSGKGLFDEPNARTPLLLSHESPPSVYF
ncbi:hypothetical protein WR25_23187 [Diploscapter pachys]|uniref:Uncharacterized protein n=1 Tax=Diploscapter pachys TaxID=2018661 RepID=A0A2A2KT44_9BILA|nr:hypothetical protein WR25_23187 [Diploscapter pachys]